MIASGGPNAATYMWYSDIAMAMALISQRSATLPGVVASFSSETTTAGVASDMLSGTPRAARGGQDGVAPPRRYCAGATCLLHRAHFLVVPGRALVERNAYIDGHVLGSQAGDRLDDRRHVADVRGHRLGHLIHDVLRQIAGGDDVRRVPDRGDVLVLLRICAGLDRKLVVAGIGFLELGHRLVVDGNDHDVARAGQIHDRRCR